LGDVTQNCYGAGGIGADRRFPVVERRRPQGILYLSLRLHAWQRFRQRAAVPAKPATVAPGQRIWYGFQHTGDRSQILSDLKAAPDNSASFAVYTPAGTATPVGRGSQQTLNRTREDGTVEQNTPYGGDLIWSGSFCSPVTYYVEAKQTGPNSSAITLGITGSSVSAPHTR
jgi:hypothetical protein